MLLKFRQLFIFLGIFFLFIAGTFIFSNIIKASHCSPTEPHPPTPPVEITNPSWCSVFGEKNITIEIEDSQILQPDHVDIYYYAMDSGVGGPQGCYPIKLGLTGKEMGTKKVFNYLWDSTEVSDYHRSVIMVFAYNVFDELIGQGWLMMSVSNGLSGTPCEPPDSSGNGDEDEPPPTSGNGSSQQTTSPTTTNQTTTTTTQTAEEKEEKKDEDGDVEELVIEEIPITIDTFDPDIFLRGGKVSLNDVENTSKDGATVLNFQGTAQPNKLVTLYIFTEATVAVVRSDEQGNWAYSLDKPIATGKHTAFATVNDENVTRRSNVAEFFIAKSTQEGKSLLLVKSGFQRFYPYAAALGVAVFLAISILAVYRIYNKRKVARA